MFVRAFVEIPVAAERAAVVLGQLPETLVESFATQAVEYGRAVVTDVGFPLAGRRVGKRVEIRLGNSVDTPSRSWIPLTWTATGPGILFPSLEGELEVAPLGKRFTQIGLSARYQPPFGVVGSTLDRMLLHRVAEATVQDFIQRMGAAIENTSRLADAVST